MRIKSAVENRWTKEESYLHKFFSHGKDVLRPRTRVFRMELLTCGHEVDVTRLQRNQEFRYCMQCTAASTTSSKRLTVPKVIAKHKKLREALIDITSPGRESATALGHE